MPKKSAAISRFVLVLAAGVAVCAIPRLAASADLPAGKHRRAESAKSDGAAARAADATDTTGAIGAPASATAAAARHALAARARFVEVRAAMERALLLRDNVSRPVVEALEAGVQKLFAELAAVERGGPTGSAEAAKKAVNATQEWYRAGLKIINPPAEGLLELPLPMSVAEKADAAAAALDHLVEAGTKEAEAPPSVEPSQPSAQARPQPARVGKKSDRRRHSIMRVTRVTRPAPVDSY
jgi:hypothetical protein